MLTFPNAKINLGLRVTGRRSDGFHDIESVFYPIPFCDVLEMIPAKEFSFVLDGIPLPGADAENLVERAWRLLHREHKIPPVSMFLLKNIPAGAGLGGGSSDAAFALRMLDGLFKLHLNDGELETYAAQLGSDCPFFIRNRPAYVSGRGEHVEELDLSLTGYHITIIYPGVVLSTREAFQHIIPAPSKSPVYNLVRYPVSRWKELLLNDFEAWAFERHPVLKEIKESLYSKGALYASMSGSGSAVYAISERKLEIRKDAGWIIFKSVL